ncbi:hypothetical protein D3C79_1031570 [compost metagenome]
MIEVAEEMEELFVPFMVFFHQPKASAEVIADLNSYSANKEFDVAVYALISAFNEA